VIEVVKLTQTVVKPVTYLTVIYVMRGATQVSFGTDGDHRLAQGDIMLFPPGISLICRPTQNPTTVIMLKARNRIVLCDRFSLENLHQNLNEDPPVHTHLEAHPTIRKFMEQLAEDVSGPMRCFQFMEIKITELFFYLRAFYRHDELARFAQPLLSPDSQFMYFIWNNYRKIRNVTQFALLANCSLSAFKVKFKNATGLSPSQWLSKQKARNVFHEISRGEKSLKEISQEYHFSSVSHLGTFCRKNFGQSPGNIKPRSKRCENDTVRQTCA
jgi:AraC-like DNA-binding protein